MDPPDVEILKLGGERLSLKKDLPEALQALERDGCLLLKGATDVTNIEHVLSSDMSSPEAVKKEIILNEFVKTILFSARNDDFHIAAYEAYTTGVQDEEVVGRDPGWKEMATTTGLVGASCAHLWGDRDVSWIIKVDKGFRGEATRDMITMKANGGDIFICNHWLRRSLPRLEKQPPTEAFFIIVSYLWKGLNQGRFYPPQLVDKVLKLGGSDCTRSGDYVIWKSSSTSR